MFLLFLGGIFRFHVCFRGCNKSFFQGRPSWSNTDVDIQVSSGSPYPNGFQPNLFLQRYCWFTRILYQKKCWYLWDQSPTKNVLLEPQEGKTTVLLFFPNGTPSIPSNLALEYRVNRSTTSRWVERKKWWVATRHVSYVNDTHDPWNPNHIQHDVRESSSGNPPFEWHKKAAKFGANFCMCGKRRAGAFSGRRRFFGWFQAVEDFDTLGMCVFEKRSGDIHIICKYR